MIGNVIGMLDILTDRCETGALSRFKLEAVRRHWHFIRAD